MASENAAWKTLKGALDDVGWGYQRFEDKFASGIPDVNVCIPPKRRQKYGTEWWIELKEAELPKRATTPFKVGLKPEQAVWHTVARLVRRRTLVLARVGRGWYAWADHWPLLRDGGPAPVVLGCATEFKTAKEFLTWLESV